MYKNSNQLAERRAAKQRADEYKAARNAPGADKGKLSRQFHKDKRNRRRDKKAESQLNYGAFQRRHQQKKYDRAVAAGTMDPANHQELLNKSGAFDSKRIAAFDNYQKRKRGFAQNPGALASMMGY